MRLPKNRAVALRRVQNEVNAGHHLSQVWVDLVASTMLTIELLKSWFIVC